MNHEDFKLLHGSCRMMHMWCGYMWVPFLLRYRSIPSFGCICSFDLWRLCNILGIRRSLRQCGSRQRIEKKTCKNDGIRPQMVYLGKLQPTLCAHNIWVQKVMLLAKVYKMVCLSLDMIPIHSKDIPPPSQIQSASAKAQLPLPQEQPRPSRHLLEPQNADSWGGIGKCNCSIFQTCFVMATHNEKITNEKILTCFSRIKTCVDNCREREIYIYICVCMCACVSRICICVAASCHKLHTPATIEQSHRNFISRSLGQYSESMTWRTLALDFLSASVAANVLKLFNNI